MFDFIFAPILRALARIEAQTTQILLNQLHLETLIMANEQALDLLVEEVAALHEVDTAIIVLLDGIAAKLEAAKTDPVKLQTVIDNIKAERAAISAAVVRNTPADPNPQP